MPTSICGLLDWLKKSFLLYFFQSAQIVLFYCLLLFICEYDVCKVQAIDVDVFRAILCRLQPGVLESFGCAQTLFLICLYQFGQQVFRWVWDYFALEVILSSFDCVMQLFHCRSPEWYSSYQHHVEADTCAPHVRFETFVTSASYYFWSYVRRSSALFLHEFFFGVNLPRDSKVANLDSTRLIKQNIIKLNISMHNKLLCVDIVEPFNHHLEQKLGVILLQFPSFSHIAEQISTLAEFHDKTYMLICFKRIIHPYNTIMTTLFQDRHFLHHASLLFFFISQNLFLDWLDGDQVFRYLMACQIDFSESSSSQYTTNSVKFTCWTFHAWVFIEVKFYRFL